MTLAADTLPPPVQIPEFEGPLDLLLDEVRRQNVAIENIALAPIAAHFLEYVGAAAERNLNLDIEWLNMAATLIQWKSRSLLPRDGNQDPHEDPIRGDLIQQLLEHRQQAADELAWRRAVEETRFTRNAAHYEAGVPEPAAQETDEPEFVSVWDLIQQARDMARWVEQYRESRHCPRESFGIEQDDTTVGEMMNYIRDQLIASGGRLDGADLVASQAAGSRRSCLFLGMLEMARHQQIEMQQDEIFGPILVSFGQQE